MFIFPAYSTSAQTDPRASLSYYHKGMTYILLYSFIPFKSRHKFPKSSQSPWQGSPFSFSPDPCGRGSISTFDIRYSFTIFYIFLLALNQKHVYNLHNSTDMQRGIIKLKYLARCVELLRDQTEKSCEKKIDSFI